MLAVQGLEKFNDMRENLDKELKFLGRQWAKRETQIVSVIESTIGMVGDLQAIAGKAMPEIPSLDIPLPESQPDLNRKSRGWSRHTPDFEHQPRLRLNINCRATRVSPSARTE